MLNLLQTQPHSFPLQVFWEDWPKEAYYLCFDEMTWLHPCLASLCTLRSVKYNLKEAFYKHCECLLQWLLELDYVIYNTNCISWHCSMLVIIYSSSLSVYAWSHVSSFFYWIHPFSAVVFYIWLTSFGLTIYWLPGIPFCSTIHLLFAMPFWFLPFVMLG